MKYKCFNTILLIVLFSPITFATDFNVLDFGAKGQTNTEKLNGKH